MSSGASKLEFFWRFWPRSQLQDQVRAWKRAADEEKRTYRGLKELYKALFLAYMAVSLLQGHSGVCSRQVVFGHDEEGVILNKWTWTHHISAAQYQSITSLIGKAGFSAYEPGHLLADGRTVMDTDSMGKVRKFTDLMFQTFRSVYTPGRLLVEDDSMIEWTGASVMHKVYIANKPHLEGFCIKTLVDGNTRIILAGEFVEHSLDKGRMATERGFGKVACTMRVVSPYANLTPRVLICDAWFGTLGTARLLQRHCIECVLNMKGYRRGFPRASLMAEALPVNQKEHQRGDCAFKYVDVRLQPQAPPKRLYAVLHTDNKPQSLLCTLGTSNQPAVPQIRRKPYRDSDGVLQNFVGILNQPGIHQLCRTKFNGVDNFNKLQLGPGSCVHLDTSFEAVRVFLAFFAMAETNAYLAYQQVNCNKSHDYSHSKWRMDLAALLLKEAEQLRGGAARADVGEGGEPVDRGHKVPIPAAFAPHWWNVKKKVNKRCVHCGDRAHKECHCGAGACFGEPCMLWHILDMQQNPTEHRNVRARSHKMH